MTAGLLILGAVLFLATEALFSGFETGLYSVNRIRVRLQLELRSFGSRSLAALLHDLPGSISSNLIGTNLSLYFCTACVTELCRTYELVFVSAEFASTLMLTPLVFIFAEMVPKDLFRRNADRWCYYAAPALRAAHWILYPFAIVFRTAGRLAGGRRRPEQETPLISRLGLRALIGDSQEEGVLTAYQTAIAGNITHLENKRLRDVMVPMSDVIAVGKGAPVAELEGLSVRHEFSRFPVHDGREDSVIGVVNVMDHLFADRPGANVADLLRPAPALGDGDGIHTTLVRLRRERMPMGIVQDPTGRAVGIVTVKDLVEEIVGELESF